MSEDDLLQRTFDAAKASSGRVRQVGAALVAFIGRGGASR
jgi:hypothetical protein